MTTETATAEAFHRLRRLRPALRELTTLLADKRVVLVPVLDENPRTVGELLTKYPMMDAGDATLVLLSERCPKARLITLDGDFEIYRRHRNQPIPVVSPTQDEACRDGWGGSKTRSKPPSQRSRNLG